MTDTMETRETSALEPHPVLKDIPALAKDHPDVKAAARTLRRTGLQRPLQIDEQNRLLDEDSRMHWLAAKAANLREVPVVVLAGALAPFIALTSLVHRRHFSKSAIAYMAVPMLEPAFKAAQQWQAKCLQIPNVSRSPLSGLPDEDGPTSVAEFAEELGICRSLLFAAKDLRAEFERDQKRYEFENDEGQSVEMTLKQRFEPRILAQLAGDEHEHKRPMGLGGVKKAIGSVRSTKGELRGDRGQLTLFTEFFDKGVHRFRYFDDLDATQQEAAVTSINRWVEAMPDTVFSKLEAAMRARKKVKRDE